MKDLISKAKGYFATFGTGAAMGLLKLQSDFDYSFDTTTSTTDDSAGLLAGTFGLVIACVAILFALVVFGFNIWMIIDCAKRDFEQKTLWIILLIAGLFFGFGWIVAIIY